MADEIASPEPDKHSTFWAKLGMTEKRSLEIGGKHGMMRLLESCESTPQKRISI
jgi:hypothetical protein